MLSIPAKSAVAFSGVPDPPGDATLFTLQTNYNAAFLPLGRPVYGISSSIVYTGMLHIDMYCFAQA